MPEVVTCSMCQKKLRVPEDLMGQEVRCPTCGHTFTATISPSAPPPQAVQESKREPLPREDRSEPTYGLERPSRRPRDDEDEDRPRRRSRRREDDDDDEDDDRPRRRRSSGYLPLHRGPSVLTMGILGLLFAFCCCLVGLPLSIVAVVMGNSDLAAMNRGAMDESGRGSTNAGVVCGWIGIVVSILNAIASFAMQSMNGAPWGQPRRRF